ncbi:MAG: hypothetical protein COA88_12715 [Kordia sp.]|nr:MAG: hypothetical protein COA88_12715 [Kordia sp.]
MADKSKIISWLPVIIIMLVVASISLNFHFSGNYVLAGVDGPYYPLQVRSMMEHFHLGLPDMPLLFIFEGLIAKFFLLLQLGTSEECILFAVKLVDILIPPLAAIPVFLLSKELRPNKKRVYFLSYLIVGYSVLNFTTILKFANNFQKNAVAVVLIFFYLYYIFRILKYSKRRDVYYLFLVLLACVLTHFGSASILLFITGTIFLSYLGYNKKLFQRVNFKSITILFAPLFLILSTVAIFDSNRFDRLLYLPFKVFESPVLLMIFDGQEIARYLNPINFIAPNLLAIIALIIFIVYRKTMDKHVKVFGFGLLISAFLLASPLIGIEWASRFYMMSYIPIVGIYLIFFNTVKSKWILVFPVFIFSILICIPLILGFKSPMLQSISNDAYLEFKQIRNKIIFSKNTAIVARQDLRILGSWEFRTKGIANYLLTKNQFKKYDDVYFLQQTNGINYTQETPGSILKIPADSHKVFHGDYFELYKVNSIDFIDYEPLKVSQAQGIIVNIIGDSFIVKNKKTGKTRTVTITKDTHFRLINKFKKISKGMLVEIWGEGRPFSLTLEAQTIIEIK